jgi:hypothetical protein
MDGLRQKYCRVPILSHSKLWWPKNRRISRLALTPSGSAQPPVPSCNKEGQLGVRQPGSNFVPLTRSNVGESQGNRFCSLLGRTGDNL